MHPKRILTAASVAGGAAALLAGAAALAATAPLPKTAAAYDTHGYQHGVDVTLVTSATNPRKIIAGPAPLGSNFAIGGIFARCPRAHKSAKTTPFITIAFPALTLKLSHGKYRFSKTFTIHQFVLASTVTGARKLKITFTGAVASSSLIRGTVHISGSPCTTAATYKATPDPSIKVAPGQ